MIDLVDSQSQRSWGERVKESNSMTGAPSAATAVYLEVGAKRIFACALDWPGWCRAGRDEGQALDALVSAAPRYAAVAMEAGIPFPSEIAERFDVVERLAGSATTDFGAPDRVAARDSAILTPDSAARLVALVTASWTVFDRVVAKAPAELRKGPRGGGRDRDAVAQHVLAAESAYARKLGIRPREPTVGDAPAIATHRAAIAEALRQAAEGRVVLEKGWPAPYAARRIAWHVLDHAWEIEDRSTPVSQSAS
jgi:hypothetical protein